MNRLRLLALGMMTLGTAAAVLKKMADERSRAPGRFINDALTQGTAEIEAAKLALEKSSMVEIKAFAYEMIDDHTLINQHLRQLARNKGHRMHDDAQQLSNVQHILLALRDAADFDRAYLRRQVDAHRKAVTTLNKATDLDDFEVSSFARRTLPKLEHHLKMAQELERHLAAGPLKPGGRQEPTVGDDGVWPVDQHNPNVREPQQGDTPKATGQNQIGGADNSGGSTTRAPGPDDVIQESHPAKPAGGSDEPLAKGSPQEVRGNPDNPRH
jgi:putative membrane protein